MKTLLVSALALGALASAAALAEPVRLTDAEMDGVTAAGFVGVGAFGTRTATFGRTIVPPVFDPIPPLLGDRFDLPGEAVVVIIDDDRDLIPLRDRRDIRLALPARRDFRAAPVTVIVLKHKIFLADGALRD